METQLSAGTVKTQREIVRHVCCPFPHPEDTQSLQTVGGLSRMSEQMKEGLNISCVRASFPGSVPLVEAQ